jgi:hypothetical protein
VGSNPSFSAKCKTLENAGKSSNFKGFSLFLNHLKLSQNVSKYPKNWGKIGVKKCAALALIKIHGTHLVEYLLLFAFTDVCVDIHCGGHLSVAE